MPGNDSKVVILCPSSPCHLKCPTLSLCLSGFIAVLLSWCLTSKEHSLSETPECPVCVFYVPQCFLNHGYVISLHISVILINPPSEPNFTFCVKCADNTWWNEWTFPTRDNWGCGNIYSSILFILLKFVNKNNIQEVYSSVREHYTSEF